MRLLVIVFIVFTLISVFLRYTIGIPVTCPRFQTRFKLQKIPKLFNAILFFSISEKPICLHIILLQLSNIVLFIFSILSLKSDSEIFKNYIKVQSGIMIFIIVILAVEEIVLLIKGKTLYSINECFKVNLDELTAIVYSSNGTIECKIGLFIHNQIVFYNMNDNRLGSGTVDFKNKRIVVNQVIDDELLNFSGEFKRVYEE